MMSVGIERWTAVFVVSAVIWGLPTARAQDCGTYHPDAECEARGAYTWVCSDICGVREPSCMTFLNPPPGRCCVESCAGTTVQSPCTCDGSQVWTRLSDGLPSPDQMQYVIELVYDASRGKMYVFFSERDVATATPRVVVGVWNQELSTLELQPSTNAPDHIGTLAFDPMTGHVLGLGLCAARSCPQRLWSWNPDSGAWTMLAEQPRMSGADAGLLFVRPDNRVTLATSALAIHELDRNTWTWTLVASVPSIQGGGMAYVREHDTVVKYGGVQECTTGSVAWDWQARSVDLRTMEAAGWPSSGNEALGPPAASSVVLVYDPSRSSLIMLPERSFSTARFEWQSCEEPTFDECVTTTAWEWTVSPDSLSWHNISSCMAGGHTAVAGAYHPGLRGSLFYSYGDRGGELWLLASETAAPGSGPTDTPPPGSGPTDAPPSGAGYGRSSSCTTAGGAPAGRAWYHLLAILGVALVLRRRRSFRN